MPSPDPAAPSPAAPSPGEGGIPQKPAGGSNLNGELDTGTPVGPTPATDFWEALYGRRSIRRFDDRPVPRELVDQ
ncbi:MAG: hypothetical protein AAF368_17740, partial [Planctomycetota bacterium]